VSFHEFFQFRKKQKSRGARTTHLITGHSGSSSNSPNFVTWLLLSNSQATSLIWSAHTVSLACCDHPHRSFCQFCRTTRTLLLVVSLLLLRDFGTLFHWTVELLHPLIHLRSVLRHFSLIRHNRTVACASVLWRDINWLIDWGQLMPALNYSVTHVIRHSCSYCTANGWLEDQEQQFFYNGITAMKKRWTKCISVAGVYVEKWQNMMCVSRS